MSKVCTPPIQNIYHEFPFFLLGIYQVVLSIALLIQLAFKKKGYQSGLKKGRSLLIFVLQYSAVHGCIFSVVLEYLYFKRKRQKLGREGESTSKALVGVYLIIAARLIQAYTHYGFQGYLGFYPVPDYWRSGLAIFQSLMTLRSTETDCWTPLKRPLVITMSLTVYA